MKASARVSAEPVDGTPTAETATDAAIRSVRLDFGDELVPARVAAEREAAALLDDRAGSMTREEALQLGRLLNRHVKQGVVRQDRFSPAFHGNAMYRLVDDLDAFNAVVADIWTATEDQALDAVGRMFGDRSVLHGAGTSFPSALMYLRDPDRWAVLIHPTHGGLDVLTGRSTPMPRDRRSYEAFAQTMTAWREQHGVAPQEADVVLTEVWRLHKPAKPPAPPGSPDPTNGTAVDAGDPGTDMLVEPELSLADVADACHLPVDVLEGWVSDLARKPQAYFYGPPGTGKTHVASLLARHLATSEAHVTRVQFHPSYSYEDFVEGLRPDRSPEGHLTYAVRPGIFQKVCSRAQRAPGERFVVVLDEMNRADLASVFGELLQLLEYRGHVVELPYSQELFSVPPNIVVLATMNTADRSLAALDFALRRRFLAFQLSPSADVLRSWLDHRPAVDAELVLELFSAVADAVGPDSPMAPGHSSWMVDGLGVDAAARVWDHEVRPYLQEHWFDQPEHLERLDRTVRGILAEHL